MSTSHEGIVNIPVGYGLLIRQSGRLLMALTDLICPVDLTDVQSCWLFVHRKLRLDGCVPALWYLHELTALLWVAPYPGEASAASTKTLWQSQTRRVHRRR